LASDIAVLSGMSPGTVVAIAAVVFVGAAVQSVFGFGLGVLAAPMLLFIEPSLMPETLLVAAAGLPVLTLWADRGEADLRGLRWALIGRVPGMLAGVAVLAIAYTRLLGVLVALCVLASVAISVVLMRRKSPIRRTPVSLTIAGGVAGFTGTTVAVGGPPMALVYQDASAARVRATLAVYFLIGTIASLATIGVFGILDSDAVLAGLACLPLVAAGHFLSTRWRNRLDDSIRVGVLAICAMAAIALLIDSLR
jgi:uncharacterized membrane protein YfcA